MGKPVRILDPEMIYIIIAFYIALAFFTYSLIFLLEPGTIIPIVLMVLFCMFPIIIWINWNRYAVYDINERSLNLRFGSILLFRNTRYRRPHDGSVCIIQPSGKFLLMGNRKKPSIYIVDKKGKDLLKIDQPPKNLIGEIEKVWGIESVRKTRVGFFQDLHERKIRNER